MPRPSMRTRSKKRLQTKTSGGQTTTHYRKKKTNIPSCSNCGQKLAGLPRQERAEINVLPANQRRVERLYGGTLCHSCLRDLLKRAARNL